MSFHLLEWGSPSLPHLLLLHGGNQSAHSWDLVSLHLADRFHIIALDQRGHGDSEWADIVRWSLNAMIIAEEKGITSTNVDEMLNSKDPETLRLLGVTKADTGAYGSWLGLDDDWAYQIIKQVGNYSESFERHIGVNTPINIARGLNALYKDGGILYAPPFR